MWLILHPFSISHMNNLILPQNSLSARKFIWITRNVTYTRKRDRETKRAREGREGGGEKKKTADKLKSTRFRRDKKSGREKRVKSFLARLLYWNQLFRVPAAEVKAALSRWTNVLQGQIIWMETAKFDSFRRMMKCKTKERKKGERKHWLAG